MNLLSVGNDAKTKKGDAYGVLTGVMYLAPVQEAGRGNVCPFASKGCSAACLYSAGRGKMQNVVEGRVRKTNLWFDDKPLFWTTLVEDIRALRRKAKREGKEVAVRINGTSDIPWEKVKVNLPDGTSYPNIMAIFPDVQFYDYTKWPVGKRGDRKTGKLPKNYHLTFSLAEDNDETAAEWLKRGHNVAAVFKSMPDSFTIGGESYPVIDGDKSDLRFTDPMNVIVGLKAKGDARKDKSGFVR